MRIQNKIDPTRVNPKTRNVRRGLRNLKFLELKAWSRPWRMHHRSRKHYRKAIFRKDGFTEGL